MTQEQTFRIAAGVILFVGGPIGVHHRLRARRLGAKVTRAQEPLGIRIPLRLCGLTAMAILMAWLVRPGLVAWAMLSLPDWVRWVGVAMALSVVPLVGWTFHTLGHNLTDTVATRANSYLVTTGPYRWVRHPFYVTAAIFAVGMSLLCALWPIFIATVVMFTLLALRTPLEERKLIERFGEAYVNYAARTGRYLPRLGP